jgi:oligopeptide transport system substrate-binding protein
MVRVLVTSRLTFHTPRLAEVGRRRSILRMLRHSPVVSFFLASMAFLSGCGKDTRSEMAHASQRSGGLASEQIWKVGNGSEPQDLDPQTVTGVTEHKIIMALFEGLASEDPKDLHPVPGLAESWDISEDGKIYTFRLRPNLKWSNGDPIVASEII